MKSARVYDDAGIQIVEALGCFPLAAMKGDLPKLMALIHTTFWKVDHVRANYPTNPLQSVAERNTDFDEVSLSRVRVSRFFLLESRAVRCQIKSHYAA
jgi:hypothetical protein